MLFVVCCLNIKETASTVPANFPTFQVSHHESHRSNAAVSLSPKAFPGCLLVKYQPCAFEPTAILGFVACFLISFLMNKEHQEIS